MRTQLLFLTALVLTSFAFAQNTYMSGHYVDNQGNKVSCLIKNIDWKNSPVEILVKSSEDSESVIKTLSEIKGFEIYGESKFEKHEVAIDKSSDVLANLESSKEPVFQKETLLLKTLVDGDATLHSYQADNLIRFFYQKGDAPLRQLIYKRYRTEANQVAKNNQFRQQLFNNFKCDDFNVGEIRELNYRKDELIDFFTTYNSCNGKEGITYVSKERKVDFNLSIKLGVGRSSFELGATPGNPAIDFGSKTVFRPGIEAEFVMPFNNRKWATVIEPTYQKYSAETDELNSYIVDYSSIELPIGIRHYFFLDDTSKLFLNVSYAFDLVLDGNLERENTFFQTDLPSRSGNFVLGAGYKFADSLSLEIRYYTRRDLVNTNLASDFNTAAIIFGYTVF